jgi:hypothetical protein
MHRSVGARCLIGALIILHLGIRSGERGRTDETHTPLLTAMTLVCLSMAYCEKEGPGARRWPSMSRLIRQRKVEATEKAGDALERAGDKIEAKAKEAKE